MAEQDLAEYPLSYQPLDTSALASTSKPAPQFSDIVSDPDYQRLSSGDQYKVRRSFYQKVLAPDPDYQKLSSDDRSSITKSVLFPEAKAEEPSILQNIAAGPVGAGLEAIGRGIKAAPG